MILLDIRLMGLGVYEANGRVANFAGGRAAKITPPPAVSGQIPDLGHRRRFVITLTAFASVKDRGTAGSLAVPDGADVRVVHPDSTDANKKEAPPKRCLLFNRSRNWLRGLAKQRRTAAAAHCGADRTKAEQHHAPG